MTRDLFRTRIKFCGFTRPGDVRLASELGVDAIGLVFAHASRRRVRVEDARAIRNALAPLVDVVALFANNSIDEVREAVRQVRPTLLQFHGDEDDGFCRAFGLPYAKAIPMEAANESDARALQTRYPGAAAFLFDSHGEGGMGGSGRTFDWSHLPTGLTRPFILAGGLHADNVFEAIQATLPWGVDVCSGIEIEPGVKDGEKMLRFVEEVRRADCTELHEETDGDACDACG